MQLSSINNFIQLQPRSFKRLVGFWVVFLMVSGPMQGQDHFKHAAAVPAVDSAGFYRLWLPPEVTTGMKPSRADLRIFDQDDQPVPFLTYNKNRPLKWRNLPGVKWRVEEKNDHETRIKIEGKNLRHAQRLVIEVDGPQFFHRFARICSIHKKRRRRKTITYSAFHLSSNQKSVELKYTHKYQGDLYLIIENEDNQPLQVKNIAAKEKDVYLTVWLEEANQYQLRFGNPSLAPPQFDLDYFREEIPAHPPLLKVIPEKGTFRGMVNKVRSGLPLWVIWLTLLVLVIVLALLSVRMIRNLDEKTNTIH